MDFTNRQVMNKGLDALQGKWPIACGAGFTALLPILVSVIIQTYINNESRYYFLFMRYDFPINYSFAGLFFIMLYVVSSIVSIISILGINIFTLKIVKNQPVYFSDIFRGFNYYKKVIPIALLFCGLAMTTILLSFIARASSGVFELVFFAWLVLYMIICLMLSQVYFVLIDNPNMKVVDILITSKNMVNGYKWQLFRLVLVFSVLGMFCLFTLGVWFIWLVPFWFTCLAQFYLELKQRYHPAS